MKKEGSTLTKEHISFPEIGPDLEEIYQMFETLQSKNSKESQSDAKGKTIQRNEKSTV